MLVAFVEDSDDDFAMFRRVFSGSGSVERWATAEAALRSFGAGETDLGALDALIVDLHLPGMDGVALIAAARALPGGDVPMVCMLTSSESETDIARARDAGADGYLIKPGDVAGLRALPGQVEQIIRDR